MSRHSCTPISRVLMMVALSRRPYPLPLGGPVSISFGFPEGLGFWAHPAPRPHAPDRLLRHGEKTGELLRSRGPFVAVGRAALFAGSVGVKAGPASWPAPEPCPFWARPVNLRRPVPNNDDCVLSPKLPVHRCARRRSRSGSALPPFSPCTAACRVVGPARVGYAVTGSPPGWESHPH